MAYRQEETVADVIARSGVLAGRVPWYPTRDTSQQSSELLADKVVS
jgi:methylenetetrahydrofolate reductase (NADPH)